MGPEHVLSSWKEIASYLGVSVRTAQLWEEERGLPVRRLPGPRGRVYATPADLDEWRGLRQPSDTLVAVAVEPPPQPVAKPRLARWVAVAALVVTTAGVAAWGWMNRPRLMAARIESDAVVGVDAEGTTLWRKVFEPLKASAFRDGQQRLWTGDLDGDGRVEVLITPTPAHPGNRGVPLVCLDDRGRERWRFAPNQTINTSGSSFSPPWMAGEFVVVNGLVVVESRHHLYYPTQVAVLNSKGEMVGEYWHPGHLNAVAVGHYRGREVVFFGGVNNARKAATLVVLDPRQLHGAGREESPYDLPGAGGTGEVARLLMPPSSLPVADPYNVVFRIFAEANGVAVDIQEESSTGRYSVIYHFDADLRLRDIGFSDEFATKFRTTLPGKSLAAEQQKLAAQITRLDTANVSAP